MITKQSEPRDLGQAHTEFLQSRIEIRDALGATAEADKPASVRKMTVGDNQDQIGRDPQ